MRKKSPDIFIYTAAVVSCIIMVVLLTTSTSISYDLDNGSLPEVEKSRTIKHTIPEARVEVPELPTMDSVLGSAVSDLVKESSTDQEDSEAIVLAKNQKSEYFEDDGTEIDKLVMEILLHNKASLDKRDGKSDKVLDIYQGTLKGEKSRDVEPAPTRNYSVRKGDCLFNIARANGVSMDALVRVNNIRNPNFIQVGQRLVIPRGETDTLRHDTTDAMRSIANKYQEESSAPIQVSKPYLWPLNAVKITSGFGMRRNPFSKNSAQTFHSGVDLAGMPGDRILAAQDGTIMFAGRKGGYGNTVVISHADGYMTVYAHAQSLYVKVGQTVKQGHPIATVGSSGKSTGPHLHFEVRKNTRAIDPVSMLRLAGR